MEVAITIKRGNFEEGWTADEFSKERESESVFGRLALALADEKVWSDELKVSAFFFKKNSRLCIFHPAFLDGRPLIIRSIDCSDDLTVDGVKEAVLAHIGAQLKELQKQSALLQLKSASLNDAQSHIFRTVAVEAVVAKFPDAVGCRLFAPRGGSDFTCFILGHGFGHTTFVARGDCPEYSGGIVQIDMPGDEWLHLERRKQHERFWTELAKVFTAHELKIPEDDLCWQKTFVIEVHCAYHADEVLFLRRDVHERISVTFDVDSLPTRVAVVAEEVS